VALSTGSLLGHAPVMLIATEDWARRYPGASIGMLVMRDAANVAGSPVVQALKERTVAGVRAAFPAPEAIKADPVLLAYRAYYKQFGKTYHVAGQLESVALKGRDLPAVSGLVDCMFAAELRDRLLTAGHDLAACVPPFTAGAAAGAERFTTMRGEEKELKPADMFIADAAGVISCVILGPDQRTRITPETRDAVYFVYAPPGVPETAVRAHLELIRDSIRLFAPQARDEELSILRA
jgi:DNA/RNA-binding domain of Phe-tRNA-synthetase-like protein